ncbi:MAG: DUF5668 domain-containing protein [Bacteroides sp.]|nr:DUF5668 domain-containing protein [Bacteroides sp.]
MRTYKHGHPAWHHYLNVTAISFILIAAGALLLARNLGYLDPYLFGLLVSWQSLLIFIGGIHLIKGHFLGGMFVAATGVYFLLPKVNEMNGT